MSKIKISYPFAVLIALLVFFDTEHKLLITVSAMLIHELGHIFGLIYKKIPFQSITIGLCGANITYGKDRLTSYAEDIFIALMGSCFNFAAILLSLTAEKLTGQSMSFFIGINALLGMFNMVPIIPLDGGRVMVSMLAIKLGVTDAENIMKVIGTIAAVCGIIAGIIFIGRSGNFTLLLVSSAILLKNVYE